MLERKRAVKTAACILMWIIAAAIIYMMFDFSGQSAEESQAISTGFTQKLLDWLPFIRMDAEKLEHILRKIAHFCLFAAEGFCLSSALRLSLKRKKSAFISAAAVCALLAILNELHQLTSADRSCQVSDMFLDFGGAICGMAFLLLAELVFRRLRHR